MYFAQDDNIMKKIAQEYQKSHKGNTMTLIRLQSTELLADALTEKPDVYIGDYQEIGATADMGLYADLQKLLPKKVLNDIMPTYIAAYSINMKLLSIPITGCNSVLYYNSQLFKDRGLENPKTSWRWDKEFYEACKKLSRDTDGDGVIDRWGITDLAQRITSSIIYDFGGSIVDKESKRITYTQKPAIEAIDFVVRLYKENLAEVFDWSTYSDTNHPFFNGNSAMIINWGYTKQNLITKNESFIPDTITLPKGPKKSTSVISGSSASILKKTRNRAAAVDFVEFLLRPESQTILCGQFWYPATFTSLNRAQFVRSVKPEFLRAYKSGKAESMRKDVLEVEGMMWHDIQLLGKGELSRSKFLSNAKEYQKRITVDSPYSMYLN